jgi:hypothetical protein
VEENKIGYNKKGEEDFGVECKEVLACIFLSIPDAQKVP